MNVRNISHIQWAVWSVLAVILFSAPLAWTQRVPGGSSGASVAWKPATANASPDELAGEDRCRSCHKAESTAFSKTGHAHLASGGKSVLSCEACHGPGRNHADAEQAAHGDDAKTAAATKLIFSFKAGARENSERCLGCHSTGKKQDGFAHSAHMASGVSCNDCHSTHLTRSTRDESKGVLQGAQAQFFTAPAREDEARWLQSNLLKSSQPDLCFSCHATVKGQFAMPTHHRVPEGLMKCTDCHNAHGSQNASKLVKSQTETCTQCHVEKRGPFVYEHPASKVDGCTVCHNPHGSANRMLLERREGRQLCLQCHTGFRHLVQAPHGKLGFQTSGECTRCHVTVHGSNFDEFLLR